MKYTYTIYHIRNIINNKIYIGCSKTIDTRLYLHVNDLRKNKHHNQYLQNSWNKYGEENFVFEIVECLFSEEDMFNREKELIDTTPNIYNIAAGGLGGNTQKNMSREQSEHYRNLKSIEMKRRYSLGLGPKNAFHVADEIRKKELSKVWSDCKKGLKNANAKYPQKIAQINLNNETIKVWDNIYSIREDKEFTAKYVLNCCNNKKGYYKHKDYKWQFIEEN